MANLFRKSFVQFGILLVTATTTANRHAVAEQARAEDHACRMRVSNYSLPPHNSSSKNINLVYLRRARKAGSTTVFNDLVRLHSVYASVVGNQTSAFKIQGMEYEAMNVQFVFGQGALLARSNGVIKIAHFREPLSRINSEFWFKGPGKAYNTGNESIWKAWLSESAYLEGGGIPKFNGVQGVKFNEGIYFSNYYTRLYSKRCGGCQQAKDKRGWKGAKGCAAHTKLYPYLPLAQRDLDVAKEVLSRFDMVLIMEWFNMPVQKMYFKRKLEVMLQIAPHTALFDSFDGYRPLGVNRVTSTGREKDHDHQNQDVVEFRSAPPPSISDILKKDNSLDIAFYEHARAVAQKAFGLYEAETQLEESVCRQKAAPTGA